MSKMTSIEYTNIGSRKTNEDSFWSCDVGNLTYACIADGVGGLSHGEVASNFIVSEFKKYSKESAKIELDQFITLKNSELIGIAKNKLKVDQISTTFSAGIISSKLIKGIHVGDSRICVLRGNGIKQLTQDHTEIGRLIREGKIDIKDRKFYSRKNVIESILGSSTNFEFQRFQFELNLGDRVLFSSDGFHEVLSKEEIRDISIKYKSLSEFRRTLIIELENRILHDNCTFVCIEV